MNVWVFNGNGGSFPGGVFSKKEIADDWIRKHSLSGILTEYPVDEGIYDYSLANGSFKIKREDQAKPEFIQRFSSAALEHFHYTNGKEEGGEQG